MTDAPAPLRSGALLAQLKAAFCRLLVGRASDEHLELHDITVNASHLMNLP